MIEKIILDYLNQTLPAPAYSEEPEERPARYVLIEKTGSGRENHINSATIVIQSYAESLFFAAELNENVLSAMKKAAELNEICRIEKNSDYNYTDTETKRYRYQAVFDIVYY